MYLNHFCVYNYNYVNQSFQKNWRRHPNYLRQRPCSKKPARGFIVLPRVSRSFYAQNCSQIEL